MIESAFGTETQTQERYLLSLYKLQRHRGGNDVPMGDLATSLEVTAGTATAMMKRLAEAELVDYRPYSGVTLSDTGRRAALRLVRRHRLLECFLSEVLDYEWSDVHAEAERLEFGVSDDMLARIDAYLGHPSADPHGNPIPSADGELATDDAIALSRCQTGDKVRFIRIGELAPAFLDLLAQHGWRPSVEGLVADNNDIAETVSLQTGDHAPLVMSRSAADQIFIEVV